MNTLVTVGSGSTSLGGQFDVVTSGITAPACVTVLAFGSASFPIFGGVGLVDPAQYYTYFVTTVTGGATTLTLNLPVSPNLAGLTANFQALAPDAGQPQGWALSNGLELVICP
ncbi:MAG: hypothetical protein R3F34_00630 [Planctomycetota bacterium]